MNHKNKPFLQHIKPPSHDYGNFFDLILSCENEKASSLHVLTFIKKIIHKFNGLCARKSFDNTTEAPL